MTDRGRIIDGRAYAAELMKGVKDAVRALDGAVGIATLLVGDDYAAQVYQRAAERQFAGQRRRGPLAIG
jgi:5,10-methylene-tetrahydrofolate dehydrogenase/methenyl tetrahydrofolate cyclohydrolase